MFLAKVWRGANERVTQIFYGKILAGGLNLINELAIDYSGKLMTSVMKLFLVEENYPIAFYCTAGKDRTGLIAMLLLSSCGATDEQILNDYKISDNVYLSALGDKVHGATLDPFLRATPDIMEKAMKYTRTKYGSLEKYLDVNGFDEADRMKLR
jgi:protein tyrosine/serine phosphatase